MYKQQVQAKTASKTKLCGHLQELAARVLLEDGNQRSARGLCLQLLQSLSARTDLRLPVAGVLLQAVGVRVGLLERPVGNEDCGGCDLRVGVLQHAVVGDGKLDQVGGVHGELLVLAARCLEEAAQEGVGSGHCEVELEGVQDKLLHGEDLFLGVCLVGDVDKIPHFWSPDLLILGGNQHCCDTDLHGRL